MKPGSVKFFSVLGLLVLGGCASQDMYGPKQTMGGLLGAVGGGVAGAQFGSGTGRLAATGAGALLGGLFGSEAGRSLDRADMMFHRGYPVQPPLVGTRGAASYASPHCGHRPITAAALAIPSAGRSAGVACCANP